MTIIIQATNLLGDSLYTLQPIRQYIESTFDDIPGPSERWVYLVADRGIAYEMFVQTFREEYPALQIFDNIDKALAACFEGDDVKIIRLDAGSSGHICFTSAQQTGKQLHISEGFAQMLGITLSEPVMPYAPWCNWEKKEDKIVRIGISPFSKSCSRHTGDTPNKTLDDWKWNPIQSYLRTHCDELCVIGGPKDRLADCPISEEEYWSANSFTDLRQKLKSLTVFITVDNGLGHIASALNVPTIILWPKVSCMEFIGPLWAPKTKYIYGIDPNTIKPAEILAGLRKFVVVAINEESNDNAVRSMES